MSPTRTKSQLTKNLRISALILVMVVALVTILGKGGGDAPANGGGGGGSGGGGGGGTGDTTAPTATIKFPGTVGLTEGDSVLVTGTASDASMITRVRLAGVDATTTDGFANWRAN